MIIDQQNGIFSSAQSKHLTRYIRTISLVLLCVAGSMAVNSDALAQALMGQS